MEKRKSEKLAKLLYDYLDSLNIDRIEVDIAEGLNTFTATIIVPDKRKDDVDEGEFLRIIEKYPSLTDVDISVICYEESEVGGDVNEIEDPDAGTGDDDPDEEDEVKADRLTVRSTPNREDYYYLAEEDLEEDERRGEGDDDDDDVDYRYPNDDDDEEYEPTQYDWEDIKGFYGDEDDDR